MNGKVKVLSAVTAVIILSALVLGCTTPGEKTVKTGDLVYVDYTLRDTNGSILETSNMTVAKENNIYDPANPYNLFSFVVGSGDTIKGFDDAVIGMKAGETKNVTVTPDKAYGEYNASKVIVVPLETITGNNTNFSLFLNETILYNGEYVYVAATGANNSTAKIVPLSRISRNQPYGLVVNANDTATVNYNHPMAGKTLAFQITVKEINPSASPTA